MQSGTVVMAVPEMIICSHGCSVQSLWESQAIEGWLEVEAVLEESLVGEGVEEPAAHYDSLGFREMSPAWVH